jgi:hypothetical protein
MSADKDYAFPQHLVRGLGAAPGRGAVVSTQSETPLWSDTNLLWFARLRSPQVPPPGAHAAVGPAKEQIGQWVQINGSILGSGMKVTDPWVWYPMPVGVAQFVSGPISDDKTYVGGEAVWSTFRPRTAGEWVQMAPNYWVNTGSWKQYILNNLVSSGTVSTPTGTGAVIGGDANAVSFRPDLARFVPSALPAGYSPIPCAAVVANGGKGEPPRIQVICDQRYLLLNTTEWPSAWTAAGLTPSKIFGPPQDLWIHNPGYKQWLATGDIFYLSLGLEAPLVGGPEYERLMQLVALTKNPQYRGPVPPLVSG